MFGMKWFMYGVLGAILLASVTEVAFGHEMTPTYPRLEPSHLNNVLKVKMAMFNKRADVEYYEIGVFDKDFNPIPFVTSYEVIKLRYLGHVSFDVYIRSKDADRVTYICSKSKLRKSDATKTAVASRICSKIRR